MLLLHEKKLLVPRKADSFSSFGTALSSWTGTNASYIAMRESILDSTLSSKGK